MANYTKDELKKLQSRRDVISYLKKTCKGFTEDKVYISPKVTGEYELVIAGQNGSLRMEKFYDGRWSLNLLIPKIERYIATGDWDKAVYLQPYTTPKWDGNPPFPDDVPFGPAIKYFDKPDVNHGDWIEIEQTRIVNKFRKEHPTKDIGFRDVPPTDKAILYT
jgi:hypothetical protein